MWFHKPLYIEKYNGVHCKILAAPFIRLLLFIFLWRIQMIHTTITSEVAIKLQAQIGRGTIAVSISAERSAIQPLAKRVPQMEVQ